LCRFERSVRLGASRQNQEVPGLHSAGSPRGGSMSVG